MSTGGVVLVALAIAVGLVGILVPLLPGTLLVYAAIAVWAVVEHTMVSWVVLGVVTAIIGASLLVKYVWPVRRMRAAEVGGWSLTAGAVLGVIGFFVIPVAGLVLGFVLGVYLAELVAPPRSAARLGVDGARGQRCRAVGRCRTGRRPARDRGVGGRAGANPVARRGLARRPQP